jgi:hypothetical protein
MGTGNFSDDFKRDAVAQITERGYPVAEVSKRLLCGRRIFCEQFDSSVLARYGRRTQRLETIVHHLGLALGGRPAAAFANRLIGLPPEKWPSLK